MIKIHALLYRFTGYRSNYAKAKEAEHIYNNLEEYYNRYVSIKELNEDISFKNYIFIKKGIWQAKHGFYKEIKWLKTNKQ